MSLKEYKNVTLYNLKKVKNKWYSGAYDKHSEAIPEFLHIKRLQKVTISDYTIIKNTNFQKIFKFNTICWGGYIFSHYGHFLMESLTRFYALRETNIKILYFTADDLVPSFVLEIFKILNIENRIVFININSLLKIDKLYIAKASYRIADYYTQDFFDSLQVYDKTNSKYLQKKIWLSRSSLKKHYILGEKKLEEKLKKKSWIIVHPELLCVEEQLSIFTSAYHISGFIGSAFHSLLLVRDLTAKLDIFLLNNNNNIHPNFINMQNSRKLKYNFHSLQLKNKSVNNFKNRYWELTQNQIDSIDTIINTAG